MVQLERPPHPTPGVPCAPSRELFLLLRSLGIACTEMEADRMVWQGLRAI